MRPCGCRARQSPLLATNIALLFRLEVPHGQEHIRLARRSLHRLHRHPGNPAAARPATWSASLRLLEEHEAKVKALEAALIAGEQSGEPQPFDSEAFLERMHRQHVRKHG
ncbi:MAG: type II toxin-antitoxin system ParD family antitoxin [Paracoccaceae bacterium]